MSLLQVFTQWTDVAPVLTKDQHVNYQRGLCDVMCDLFCSVMCCDPFSYTRVVLIHWTLRRPLLCFAGVGTRNYYRKMGYELEGPYMVKDLYEPRNDWTSTVSHLDTVTSGLCHIWTAAASAQIILFIKALFYGQFLQFIQWNVVFVSGVGGDDRWVFCHSFCFLSSAHFAVVAPPTSCRWGEGVRGRQE